MAQVLDLACWILVAVGSEASRSEVMPMTVPALCAIVPDCQV